MLQNVLYSNSIIQMFCDRHNELFGFEKEYKNILYTDKIKLYLPDIPQAHFPLSTAAPPQ